MKRKLIGKWHVAAFLVFCFVFALTASGVFYNQRGKLAGEYGNMVASNLTSYTDTGAFCIYFGTDIEDMDICLKLTYKELKRMRDVKMTSSQLAAAKKQLIGQIGVASDNFENNALGMAKTYLHYHKYESSESVFHRIEALTAEQLLEVANEMFAEEYLSTLIYK